MWEVKEWPGVHRHLRGRRRRPCRGSQMGKDGEDRHGHRSAAVFAAPRRSLLERVRTTRVSKANHELSLWLDEPGLTRKVAYG